MPLQGFSALEGMNGTQKFQIHRDDRSADRLPSAHTWYVHSVKSFIFISLFLMHIGKVRECEYFLKYCAEKIANS